LLLLLFVCFVSVSARIQKQPNHPGGDMLGLSAGRDVTRLFETYHPTRVFAVKDKYLIGRVSSEDQPEPVEPVFQAKTDFYPVLKTRVEKLFRDRGLSMRDSPFFYLKAALILSTVIGLHCVIWTVMGNRYLPGAVLAILLGIAQVSIGINIMHDGNHGAVSRHWWISRLFGYTLDLIGASSFIWHYQHNIAHHQHPNVPGHDPDIGFGSKLVRLSPAQPWIPRYRYQHVYLPILYGLLVIKWTLNDFLVLARGQYYNTRLGNLTPLRLGLFMLGKAVIFGQLLFVPWLLGNNWSYIAMVALLGEFAAGYWSTLMFAMGHTTSETKWPYFNPKTGELDGDFAVHQVVASTSFAHDSAVWNFLLGGLNYQIEHHLFPSISHVHYPMVAPVVRQTCVEYGIEYNYYPTFYEAMMAHWRHLYEMGTKADLDASGQSKKLPPSGRPSSSAKESAKSK
jgi:fatty acid desaturase